MKALSIRQPWAWLITRPDIDGPAARAEAHRSGEIKLIENRTWRTKHRGPFLIHAAIGMTVEEWQGAARIVRNVEFHNGVGIQLPAPKSRYLVRGGIVGIADLVDCVESSDSPWYMGAVGFVLENVRPLPFVPMKGSLQFFEVPDELIAGIDTK